MLSVCFFICPKEKDFVHFLPYATASELGRRQELFLKFQPH